MAQKKKETKASVKEFLNSFSLERSLVIEQEEAPTQETPEQEASAQEALATEPKAPESLSSSTQDAFSPSSSKGSLVSTTTIGVGTHIEGSITTASNIIIDGSIHGNVQCQGDVVINGAVVGDIHGESITIKNSRIDGEVVASKDFKIDGGSINGNVLASSAKVNGEIVGNISVNILCELLEQAVVIGNITSSAISMVSDAMVDGNIKITRK